ncbi:hypothetical protein AZKH_0240 [Azoarcus sp. KH32C]|nr:hypothetical protein AZKH_0240 [Azoarcus sp. KH32C]
MRLDFFSLCGLSPEHVQRSMQLQNRPDNAALTTEAILFAEALRRSHAHQPLRESEFSLKYDPLLQSIPGGTYRLSPQQAEDVEIAAREHIAYATDYYRLDLCDTSVRGKETSTSFSVTALDAIAAAYRQVLESMPEPVRVQPDITTQDLIVGPVELTEGDEVQYGQIITLRIEFYVTRALQNLELGIHIFDEAKRWAFGTNTRLLGHKFTDVPPGRHCVTHHVVANLPIGSYSAGFAFTERLPVGEKQLAWFDALCNFRVTREEDQLFAGYAYLPTEITLSSTPPAADRAIVHDASGRLETSERLSVLAPNQSLSVPLTIHNNGMQDWLGDFFRPISIAYRWLEPATGRVLIEGGRSALPQGRLAAGCLLQTSLNITTPNTPGAYTLLITLVQERVAWFDRLSSSFQPTRLDISIEATPTD